MDDVEGAHVLLKILDGTEGTKRTIRVDHTGRRRRRTRLDGHNAWCNHSLLFLVKFCYRLHHTKVAKDALGSSYILKNGKLYCAYASAEIGFVGGSSPVIAL